MNLNQLYPATHPFSWLRLVYGIPCNTLWVHHTDFVKKIGEVHMQHPFDAFQNKTIVVLIRQKPNAKVKTSEVVGLLSVSFIGEPRPYKGYWAQDVTILGRIK